MYGVIELRTILVKSLKNALRRFELWFWEIRPRMNWVNDILKQRVRLLEVKQLTGIQKESVNKKWGEYAKEKSFNIYARYVKETDALEEYIPDRFYMERIEPFFNKCLLAKQCEDKNLYDMFFAGLRMPATVVRYIDGMFLDEKYHIVTKETVIERCKSAGKVIIKVASESGGGHGIDFWQVGEPIEELISKICKFENVIVQTLISQHHELSRLHESSINTLRITTIIFEGEVIVSSHFLRMGVNGMKVDNVSSGGILCAIERNGVLAKVGYDEVGRPLECHPTSGVKFEGSLVPNFDKCVALCVEAAPRLSHIAKLVSWDIAVEDDALPTLIEANLTFCDFGIYQIACGPVLGTKEQRDRIIKAVYDYGKSF